MPCWQQSRKLDIADSSCRGWERHRRSDSQCGCVCVKTNPFCWWNKKLSPSGPPATQSKSKTQTWGRTAGRQKETKWCRSCTLTGVEKEVSIVWHWLVKINVWFHLEDTRWDEETVTLTADDHICLICSIEFLVRTEKDEYFAGMNVWVT